jgi:single-strand DNA-binding protein
MYLNKVYLIGNLTRDPELKALPSGTKVANLGLATNRKYKDKDGVLKDTTEFHNVVAFSHLGELAAQYLKKGQQALVEGRLQTRSWETPTGEKKYRTEIIADNIQFGWKGTGGSGSGPSGATSGASGKTPSDAGPATEDITNDKGAMPPGEAIEYPKEEINPDDIPF